LQEHVDAGLFVLVVNDCALNAFSDLKPDTPFQAEVREDFYGFGVVHGPGA